VVGLSLAVPVLGTSGPVIAQDDTGATPSDIVTIASGLSNPRGFSWGPDGTLYLALAGTGGDAHFAPIEGFTADIGLTSSIATIADGCATPIAQGLVSFLWEEAGWIWGAMDVAFLGEDAYALLSGAGPTFLSPSSFSGVYRLNQDGTMTLVADITSWLPANPPAFIPPDYNADGSLFDLEAAGDALLLSEAVGGQLIRVTPDGEITRVADLSEGHLVPTGIAVDADGNAYVGHETAAPYGDGASKVVKVAPDGTVTDAWAGLTVVTDVAFGPDGSLYAAEMATGFTAGSGDMPPDTGRIVRQTGPDSLEPVVTDLPYPVNIGFDADGRLVIAAPAFGPDAGVGQGVLVSVDPAEGPISYSGFEPVATDCTAPSGDAAVAIEGFAFDPASLDVAIGATVSWTNEDGTQHTVTAEDGSFDSGALSQGETFSQTFNQTFGETFGTAGTITYFCRFHPNMTGTITVAWPA
jgi:plastocyanin